MHIDDAKTEKTLNLICAFEMVIYELLKKKCIFVK